LTGRAITLNLRRIVQVNKHAAPARANDLLSTTMHKTNAVTIWIMDVHFAIAPALISWFEINDDTCDLQFFMERIHVFDSKKDYSARHSITRKDETCTSTLSRVRPM
jgi:hypothetical protein